MNKKMGLGLSVTLLILLGIVIFIIYRKPEDGYSASVAIGCTAEEYNEEAGVGYLSLVVDTPNGSVTKRIKVEDADTKTSLSGIDPKEVIGVHMSLYMSKQLISENHLKTNEINPFDLLMFSNTYDGCFSIIDVSVK